MQSILADEVGTQAGQIALGASTEALVELGRGNAIENAVAQKFEPLIVRRPVAAVGQGLMEQFRPGKPESNTLLKALTVH